VFVLWADGLERLNMRMFYQFESCYGIGVPDLRRRLSSAPRRGLHGQTAGQSLPRLRSPGPTGTPPPVPLPGAAELLLGRIITPYSFLEAVLMKPPPNRASAFQRTRLSLDHLPLRVGAFTGSVMTA
jgi:hypothetical protein